MINFLRLKNYYTYCRPGLTKDWTFKSRTGARDFCSINGDANKERCSA